MVDVSSWIWSKEKLSLVLVEHVFEVQASGMKGSSFTTGHDPLERARHVITFRLKTMSPKAEPEICRRSRMK